MTARLLATNYESRAPLVRLGKPQAGCVKPPVDEIAQHLHPIVLSEAIALALHPPSRKSV